jgi:hypothetical protein
MSKKQNNTYKKIKSSSKSRWLMLPTSIWWGGRAVKGLLGTAVGGRPAVDRDV